jgi:hypothetical protein
VNPFDLFDDAALQGRVERLQLEERDLGQRVAKRLNALEARDRWHKSDPLYQRLADVLQRTREHLRDAEEQLLKRADKPIRRGVPAGASRVKRRHTGNRSAVLARLVRPGKWQPTCQT